MEMLGYAVTYAFLSTGTLALAAAFSVTLSAVQKWRGQRW